MEPATITSHSFLGKLVYKIFVSQGGEDLDVSIAPAIDPRFENTDSSMWRLLMHGLFS
jgi:hypothetical protein